MPRSTARSSRNRVRATVAQVAGVLLVAALLAPDPGVGGSADGTECVRGGSIDSVDQLDSFISQGLDTPHWQGGDVGASTDLLDGRQLFVFADTFRVVPLWGQRLVRNSMLIMDDRCVRVVLPGDHGSVIPDRDDGVGYWPMSVVHLGGVGYSLIAVMAQRVRGTGDLSDGIFAFEILGPAAAVFVVPDQGSPRLVSVQDLGPDDVDPGRPTWGAATAVVDGWMYLYGTARGWPGGPGFALHVARVRPSDFLRQERWRYWDGSDWSRDPDVAAELIGSHGGVSQSLSVFERDGRWYAVSKRDEMLGTELTVWSAPGPTVPFTASFAGAQLPSEASTGTVRYMALAHPELLP